MSKVPYRTYLEESEIPNKWLNLPAVMTERPEPYLNPGTMQPMTKAEFAPLFCEELIEQEFDTENVYIEIPDGIREYYKVFRPSPLVRAYNLEKALGTSAKIYYKFEGNNTSGSHKLNSAVAQVYYAKEQGIKNLTTETGAGQWGTALSMACAYYGINLIVYMVKGSFEQKPFRKGVIETFGAQILASPSETTEVGKKILAEYPGTSGSLGCAISEAIEKAVTTPDTKYVLGSVLNQVLLHQSVIGLETKKAYEKIGEYPDIVIGCAGGGSNAGGLMSAFIKDKIEKTHDPYFILTEPSSCPSFTKGEYRYDFCDTGKMTPLAKMYTVGCEFIPPSNHAGGLRFHGMSPILSKLYNDRIIDEARAYKQTEVFEAAELFAKHESILPAPESAHAIKAAIDEAVKCRETGESKNILFGLSGTGYFDMTAYIQYKDGTMSD